MEIRIRAAREDDAAATAALLNPIIDAGCYTIMTNPVSAATQRAWLAGLGPRGVVHVAEAVPNRRIVGIQSVEPLSRRMEAMQHVGDISTFIALDALRAGIGRALTDATVGAAVALGYRVLLAMIRADNPGALAFYTRVGFEKRGVLREHVKLGDRFIDQVLAERLIG